MAKLTLSVDDEIIELAKDLARERGLSVSQMVSAFFSSVATSSKMPEDLPPVLAKLCGVLKPEEVDVSKYRHHLESKYL
jgi:antitoxin component of RelBE/YafQ-DinJ toxin-antitoxin module